MRTLGLCPEFKNKRSDTNEDSSLSESEPEALAPCDFLSGDFFVQVVFVTKMVINPDVAIAVACKYFKMITSDLRLLS